MQQRCRRIFSLLLVVWVLTAGACTERTSPPLRLGTNVWPGYEPLYLARALDYLNPSTVTLVEYLSASEVIRAFRNQTLEAAALTLDEVLLLQQHNVPVHVFLVTDISHGGDTILGNPTLARFVDLAGKRVGVEATALEAYVLSRALAKHNLSLTDIKVVPLEVSEHVAAYQADTIDAVVTFEPTRSQLLSLGAQELFTSREIPDEIVDVLVVHRAYLAAHPENVRHVVDAWFRALDYLAQHPIDAAQHMQKRLRLRPEEVLTSYEGLRLPGRDENRQLLGGQTPALCKTAQGLQKVMFAQQLMRDPVDTANLCVAIALSRE